MLRSTCPTAGEGFVRAPALPVPVRVVREPRVVCGRRSKRRRGPVPVSVRPVPAVKGPVEGLPERHRRLAGGVLAGAEVRGLLGSRRDVVVQTRAYHEAGAVGTALRWGRERAEHALVIATTADTALIAAEEARRVAKGASVIVAAGTCVPGGWKHPAINANSRKGPVILVASVRAALHHLLLNNHGRAFLQKIALLVVTDATGVVEVAAEKDLSRVLKQVTPTNRRKTVVFVRPSAALQAARRIEKLDFLIKLLVREAKRDDATWSDLVQRQQAAIALEKERAAQKHARPKTVTLAGSLKLKFPADGLLDCLNTPLPSSAPDDFADLDAALHNEPPPTTLKAKRARWRPSVDDETIRILTIPDRPPSESDDDEPNVLVPTDESTARAHDTLSETAMSTKEEDAEYDEEIASDSETSIDFSFESPKDLPGCTADEEVDSTALRGAVSGDVVGEASRDESQADDGVRDADELLSVAGPVDVTERAVIGGWAGCYKALCAMLVQDVDADADMVTPDDSDTEGDSGSVGDESNANNTHAEDATPIERVVVFFPTARLAECYATMARVDGFVVHDVHRRMNASKRERGLEWVCGRRRVNLFATDSVACAGTVIPQVERVVHFGSPGHAGEYRARVGLLRNGGESVLLVGEREADVVLNRILFDDGKADSTTERGNIKREQAPDCDTAWHSEQLDMKTKSRAYLSLVSFWKLKRPMLKWQTRDAVDVVNDWARQTFGQLPVIPSNIARKMRLRELDDLNIELVPPPPPRPRKKSLQKKKNKRKVLKTNANVASVVDDPWSDVNASTP